MEQLLNVKEVAELLKVNPEIVRRNARSGKLKGYKVGDWRFKESEVVFFVQKLANTKNNSINHKKSIQH